MIYETGDIKEAIKEYYEREIKDKNLVYKGRTDALHKWRDKDLERLNELERRAEAFDEIIEAYEDKGKSIDQVYKVVDEMHTQVFVESEAD